MPNLRATLCLHTLCCTARCNVLYCANAVLCCTDDVWLARLAAPLGISSYLRADTLGSATNAPMGAVHPETKYHSLQHHEFVRCLDVVYDVLDVL